MFNYRITISKADGTSQDWDFIDRMIVLYGIAWVMRSAKEVAMAYAKSK